VVVACATTDATSITIIGADRLSGLAGTAADHVLRSRRSARRPGAERPARLPTWSGRGRRRR
jgi:hypothetical protein